MSRSNPTADNPHPCQRWFEWDGSNGNIRYYDKNREWEDEKGKKQKGQNVNLEGPFVFIMLDQLSVVKGWHDPSESGITSNEIRDTTAEPFVVRSFKGATLATGFWRDIKDRVNNMGGNFYSNLYLAFKEGEKLLIGSLIFKGASLNHWVEFKNKHRSEIYKKAIQINGYTEGKKGKIKFRTPKFFLVECSPESDAKAKELDKELQAYLTKYFSRPKRDQVAAQAPAGEEMPPDYQRDMGAREGEPQPEEPPPGYFEAGGPPHEGGDVPF